LPAKGVISVANGQKKVLEVTKGNKYILCHRNLLKKYFYVLVTREGRGLSERDVTVLWDVCKGTVVTA
jgi:hypothetical protein